MQVRFLLTGEEIVTGVSNQARRIAWIGGYEFRRGECLVDDAENPLAIRNARAILRRYGVTHCEEVPLKVPKARPRARAKRKRPPAARRLVQANGTHAPTKRGAHALP